MVPVVFVAAWGGGWIALRSARHSGSGLGKANAFASGIVLGTGLLHMLPESAATLGRAIPGYPVAFLLASAAFLVLLLIEHVLLGQRGHHHGELAPHGQHELAVHAVESQVSAYALLAALSVHSVLAGIALGAQSTIDGAIAVLIAVLAHKTTEGFALGVSLVRNRVPAATAWPLLVGFSAAAPLGIGVGALAATSSGVGEILEASFSAIAAGTFLYISSLDMIGEEFSHGDEPFAKWCLALAGLAVAAALAAV